MRSCPAALPVTASGRVWVRCLLAGFDTVVLVCVNDDYASDRLGTVVQPVEKVELSVTLPSWLEPTDVFEVTSEGTRDIQSDRQDTRLTVHLGTLELTRLVLITADRDLRGSMQPKYEQCFAANVQALR